MVRIIGLTGGIASGKSTVSDILKDFGAIIIDADEIARSIAKKGKPATLKIEEYFGEEVFLKTGELDRKKLGEIVFNDPYLLKKLNDITHPYIREKIVDCINFHKNNHPDHVIMVDAALLIETELHNLVDEVWLVSIQEDIQLERLMKRDGLDLVEAKRRINAQMPLDEKKQYAHIIIDNSNDIVYLKTQVDKIWKIIMQ